MGKPDGGMFGLKLILPNHLTLPHFTRDYGGEDGKLPLMNFSGEGRGPATAANIPSGHRAIVYVTKVRRFIWAIEFLGSVEDGKRIAIRHGIKPGDHGQWSIYRPIRFLARIDDIERAPTPQDIERRTGIVFLANSFTHKYLSAEDYQKMYDAIEWDERQ